MRHNGLKYFIHCVNIEIAFLIAECFFILPKKGYNYMQS